MKKQEMTIEERKAAITPLKSKLGELQDELATVTAAEEDLTARKRAFRLALEEKYGELMTGALQEILPIGKYAVHVSQYWMYGTGKGAEIKISREDDKDHDFGVIITEGELSRYSTWSQSGDSPDDAKATIAYYEVVSKLLSFVTDPANKAMLSRVCDAVNTPYNMEGEELSSRTPDNIRQEIEAVNAEIRKLQVYVGAKATIKRPRRPGNERFKDIIVAKVTPKKFYYRFIFSNYDGNLTWWDDSASIDDCRFTFAEIAA